MDRLMTMATRTRVELGMDYRQVGTTDVQLSVIGPGGAWLGHDLSDPTHVPTAIDVLRAVHDCGVNWLDTSENYYDTGNEAVIGVALRELDDSFLVCSKAAPGAVHSGGGSGFRPEQIRRACEESLRRLGREHIDMYLLHWPDDTGVPLADTWEAMASLVTEGLVRSIGLSNYDREDMARCHEQRPVDAIQTGLNVIEYLEDRGMIAWCGEQGIAVTIYEPMASGILTDAPIAEVRDHWRGSPWEDSEFFQVVLAPGNDERWERVTSALRAIGQQVGATTAQVAVAWVLRQPGVSAAIAGSSNPDRARQNAQAADVMLTDDMLDAIEDLIPVADTA